MKKLVTIALAMVLALSLLTACGGNSNSNNTPSSGNTSGSSTSTTSASSTPSGGLTDKEIQDANDAMDQLEAWAKAQGWDDNQYGNWIYGVWDSDVLPGCVPKEIEGVKADQTTYKEKRHDTYNGDYHVGSMGFPDQKYEVWGVSFYCDDDQLDAFIGAIEAGGFFGGQTEVSEYAPTWEWIGNGYYAHLYVNAQISGEEGYNKLASFYITETRQTPRPSSFQGLKLPDVGEYLSYTPDGIGFGWDTASDNSVENFWDPYADKGTLPDQWYVWYNFFGVTVDQAKAYAQQLVSQGWTVEYENNDDYGWGETPRPAYSCQLIKNGIYAAVSVNDYSVYGIDVRFGTMAESLYY